MKQKSGKTTPQLRGRSGAQRKAPARKPARRMRGRAGAGLMSRVLRGVMRLVWGVSWRIVAVIALLVAGTTIYHYASLPPKGELLDARARGSVTLLDAADSVYAWRGETFGGQINAADVSPHLRNAIIAVEDRRFYSHFGISPRGIASAVSINLSQGRGPFSGHGGSTITQQLAKLLCLGRSYDSREWDSEAAYERDCRRTTLWRKIQEVPYAFALEAKYPKDDLLTIYLNRAYLGAGARGFEGAAQRYFGKSANVVRPAEAAMLAGLLVAPSHYAPTRNLAGAQARARIIIDLMEEQGYLSGAEAQEARDNPAQLSQAAEARAGGHFADWVMSEAPSFLSRTTTEDVILHTTLDQRIQSAAEEALDSVFAERVREGSLAQAAVVVMSADGAVRAMVGGRDQRDGGAFNRAAQARRQTGSAFKPFVFATAFELGHEPHHTVEDAPYTLHIPGSGDWSPRNYSGRHEGLVTLTEAFAQSLNVPAVKVSEAMGRDLVRQVANGFGLSGELAEGPALALGASEASLLEMTGAYAGILNGGSSVRPFGLRELRLAGDDESLMGLAGGIGERVLMPESAHKLTYMMHQVIESGTGGRARLPGREAAGKTGTTQAARDAWFIGFTADYVAGVWMGYDDNTPLTGVTGGGLPADIWREVMVRVHRDLPARELPMTRPEERRPLAEAPRPEAPGPEATQSSPPRPDARASESRSTGVRSAAEEVLRDVLGIFRSSN